MKSLSKMSFWAGIGWALLLAGAASMFAPEQFGLAGWIVVGLAGIGWRMIHTTAARTEMLAELHGSEAKAKAEESALMGEFQSLLDECNKQFTLQFQAARGELERVQSLLRTAIESLTESFSGMHAQTTRQIELTLSVTTGGSENPKQFDEFVANTSDVMQKVVDSVITNSKLGMELVDLTDSIAKSTQNVQSILSEIGSIAKQTNREIG